MGQEFLYGVRTRRAASAGLDGLTPILLVAYVLSAVGGGIYMHAQLTTLIEHGRVNASFAPGVLWTMVIAGVVLLFAVVGPMVLLGVFIASKLMKFPLAGAAYLRACGVATVPGLLLGLAKLFPPNFVLILIMMVAVVPVAYVVLKAVFELTFPEGALSFIIAGVLGVVGFIVSGLIIAALGVGAVASQQLAAKQGAGGSPAIGGVPPPPGVTPAPKAPPNVTTPPAPAKTPLETLRETLAARAAQKSSGSRESQQRELASLKARAEQVGATANADVMALLQDLERRAAAAPSEKPDAALFQPPVATTLWRPADGAVAAQLTPDEVSFKTFNLRVPRDYRADLDSSESDPKGLSFSSGRADSGKLVLRTAPASNARQRRPWVTREAFQTAAAEREKLFTIDGAGATSVDEGTINDIAFTRVVHEAGKRWGVHGTSAQYVARAGDAWLLIDAVAPSGSPAALEALETAVRTIRPRPEGDPKVDPFETDALVARLADAPDRVATLLRRRGKAAEEAVLPQLTSANAPAARAAAGVLGDIGTAKSLPALRSAAKSVDAALAAAAREALKKLQPDTMDAVAEALLDLESDNTHTRRAALDRLARITPDEPRREKVAAALEAQMLGKDAFFVGEAAAPAMAAWAGKQTVPRLAAALGDENCSMHQRRAITAVFARVKDERAVLPVVRWVIKDAQHVTDTLIAMGPVAEPEVLKLLKERDPNVRTAAARILQEIGTVKSLAGLKRASQDQRDVGAAVAARMALDIVTERWKASKPPAGATTAPTP